MSNAYYVHYSQKLEPIQKKVEEAKQQILTPLEKLDTPGKAAVQNDHEICFVGDEAYRELSRVDPEAEKKLLKAIEEDDSAKYKKPAE
ncbi:unnamed protein product [Gongylonema pulchrum]|uniref:YCII domain-containing protein n=1 Tax=Gongylonema pulchrum TaxID=637853 RepID=A0A183EUB2_9BILA|nr:unnamed protein product [Gongylonema pulchrum]